MPFTEKDILHLKARGKIRGFTIQVINNNQAKSKYGNKKVEFDGKIFDSKKELAHYLTLRMMEKAGVISDLKCQVSFELNPGGTHSLKYIADFTYLENGQLIVCDAKGYRTKVYKKKARLMLQVHGITINEV